MKKRFWSHLFPYVLLALVGIPTITLIVSEVTSQKKGREFVWGEPLMFWLLLVCGISWIFLIHFRKSRKSRIYYSHSAALRELPMGWASRLASLPIIFRITAMVLVVFALARPQTHRKEITKVEGIDIMIVLDLSRSMEGVDLRRNRLDAGQRTIRKFVKTRKNDRIGLVVFAEGAMVQCPLTLDHLSFDQIVRELRIGDVPDRGTAIGDALALALSSLKRTREGRVKRKEVDGEAGRKKNEKQKPASQVVILLSDGDSNIAEEFSPEESKQLAVDMGVKVFTILLGKEGGVFNRFSVNPQLLMSIAKETGGIFYRAGSNISLAQSFQEVSKSLEKNRRTVSSRVVKDELFPPIGMAALVFLFIEFILRRTRWRSFP